jgi:hypothetical protein
MVCMCVYVCVCVSEHDGPRRDVKGLSSTEYMKGDVYANYCNFTVCSRSNANTLKTSVIVKIFRYRIKFIF